MQFNQGEFIISLSNMKSKELTKILEKTINDAIFYFSQLYIDDFNKLEEQMEIYKSQGYMYQTKINMCIDLLTINEENETKRLMFADCFKLSIDLKTFTHGISAYYKQYLIDNMSFSKTLSELSKNIKDNDKCAKYMEQYNDNLSKVDTIDKRMLLNQFNHNVNWFLSFLVKIKATLNKTLVEKALY